ncbi:MAG: hypothetical protein MZV64_19390 [Ignavibacteriales bacterium]|nr:hypothetical protein [Ignavibacteriales bacterium]
MLALASWLSARSLESALRELRIINANLDQVVTQRTRALAESLSRERIEARAQPGDPQFHRRWGDRVRQKLERDPGEPGHQGHARTPR